MRTPLLAALLLIAACGSPSNGSLKKKLDARIKRVDPADTAAFSILGPDALAAVARCNPPACTPRIFSGPGRGEITVGLDSAASPGSQRQWHLVPDATTSVSTGPPPAPPGAPATPTPTPMIASAQSPLAFPDTELVRRMRALLTSKNQYADAQSLMYATARLWDRLGNDRANAVYEASTAAAYKHPDDDAALARLDSALGGHKFESESLPPRPRRP
jgi:hypothetical protein